MQIVQESKNSLILTLQTFEVGEHAEFSYKDFTLNGAQCYRAKIWNAKQQGLLPMDMRFTLMNLPSGNVFILRKPDGKARTKKKHA